MTLSPKHNIGTVIFAATAWLACADASLANNFGTDVTNIATVSYTLGQTIETVVTPRAVFTIRPPATPAVIEFFRVSETATDPIYRNINGSEFSPSGQLDGPFTAIGEPVTAGGQLVDISGPVPLIPATTYLAGELMFIRVVDTGQNLDSNAIDTIVITVSADNGDAITLRLFESEANSGEFFVYLPSTPLASPQNDNMISAGGNTQLTATYIDAFDSTDVTVDTAILNPLNRVFSSVTGEPVDGAQITLINLDTGLEADVFGVDGFSTFPSDVVSGEDVWDSSNLVYENGQGEFRYPLLDAGNYAVRVDPPEGYTFSSVVGIDQLTSVGVDAGKTGDNGYVILPASFGEAITLDSAGTLRFDIPLDPISDIIVTKSADRTFGDVGDYINYSVTIENRGTATVPAILHDTLPLGFRYVPGTSRIEQISSDEPQVSADASLLTFDMDLIAAGESITLDYALLIGPGATLGDAVNAAVVRDGSGEQISNIARAGITIREDLLRSTSTIVGRITEKSCDGDVEWVRPLERGTGIAGVRLYMETGAYVVSDSDGLYHFEGVSEGTHVVQVDKETLPQGFELMTCEENTRYAGSNESKFVDVQGGGIWRANFYLKQTGAREEIVEIEEFNDAKEHLKYDEAWLETQTSDIEWVYPDTDRTPSTSSTNIGIKHGRDQSITLTINDRDVPSYHYAGRSNNADRSVMISRWRGIDIQDGRNVVIATVKDSDGNVIKTLREEIWFVKTIARATPVPTESILVADGRTAPEIAIRLEDQSGRPVHAGRITTINLEPPYRLFDESGDNRLREQSEDLIAPLSARQDLSIGTDGILRVKLEPTLRTGKVTVIATLDNGRQVPIYMYLEPEKRDWILVGLAEGSVGYDNVSGNSVALDATGNVADDVITDGRVAFFAKGLIKGDWLLTLGVDTDRRRGNRDGAFRDEIDPNAFYTLYGDRSYQEFEGNSRYPVYVKLEKRQAYAVFGDYETNITEGRLTSYNRRFTGLKAEYLGENVQVLGFAAETNQGFVKDELAADGTSGTYQLSNERVLPQSEQIIIETRDRFRPDVIVESRTLVRFLDYTLDYLTGQLIFRLPVDATDANLNPNVIVVDYETSEDAERNVTFGGRVQAQFLDKKIQVGSTFVREDGSALTAGSQQVQVGVDVIADITDNTQIRAEYAITDNNSAGGGTADATLVEVVHNSEKLTGEAFFREEEAGFGLGQRASNTNNIRRYGARGNYTLDEFEDEKTGRRGQRRIEAQAFREENLSTGDSRNTGEVLATHQGSQLTVSGGLRAVRDNIVSGEDRNSTLAIARASYSLPKHGATIQLSHEQPLGGDDEVSGFPQRTTIGLDKTIGQRATVSVRHEINDGAGVNAQNTVVGVTATPWNGTTLTANTDAVTNDSGRRLGATIGVDQLVKLGDKWAVSGGIRSRRVLDTDTEFLQVTPDAAISPFEVNEDFTSAYVGAAYRNEKTSGSVRVETRQTEQGDTYIATAGAARELTETLSFAGAARGLINDAGPTENSSNQLDVRFGGAWRPRDEKTIVFNRLDFNRSEDVLGQRTSKVVNNFAANTLVNERWQLSTNWGVKNVRADIAGQEFSNTTHLVGAETRFDVTEKIDIGFRGQFISNTDGDGRSFSYGPSIGVSPVKNVWINAGYNFSGFKDDDFEAAEFSRDGVYLQMRLKFDQNTARGLLRRISPAASAAGPGASQARSYSQP